MRQNRNVFPAVAFALSLSLAAGEAEDWQTHIAAGEAALKDGRYGEAVDTFRKAAGLAQGFGISDERHVKSLGKLADAQNCAGDMLAAEATARKALELAEKHLGAESVEAARAANALGDALSAREKPAEAMPLYKRAFEIRRKTLGHDHPDTAETMGSMGMIEMGDQNYREAEKRFTEAMLLFERAGDLHKASIMLNNLAYLHEEQEKFPQAEKEYRKMLEMREKALRPDHPDIGAAASNLGALCQRIGKADESERLLKRALAIAEKSLGAEDSNVAYAANNLGFLYQSQGKHAEAERLYLRARAIWEKTDGPESTVLANLLETHATLMDETGRASERDALMARVDRIRARPAASPAEAWDAEMRAGDKAMRESLFAEAVAAYERAVAKAQAFGERDERFVRSTSALALALRNKPDLARAESTARKALALAESSLGSGTLETAEALHTLALVLQGTDRPAEAEPLYQRAIAIRMKALGADHKNVAETVNNLAFVYLDQKKMAEAEKLFAKSLAIARKLGDEPYTAFILNNLASAHMDMNRTDDAERELREALTLYERQPGAVDPDIANVCFNLGDILRKRGDIRGAMDLQQKALDVAQKRLGPDHPQVAKALHNIAVIEMGTEGGKHAEADAQFRRSRAIWEKTYGPDHPQVAQSLENHARLLDAMKGREAEAAEMRRRVEEIRARRR